MALKIKRRDTPLDENKKRQRQIAVIAIFVAAALFFFGLQVGKNTTSNPTTNSSKEDTSSSEINFGSNNPNSLKSQVTNLGPSKFDYIVPTGFSKTKDGALKAAATYIEAWPQLITATDDQVIAAIEQVTTPNSTDLKASLAQSITSIRGTFSDSIVGQFYHQSVPLKTKVISADSTNVTVSIWALELWAGAGNLEPQSSFDFHELKLIYVEGDWKIDSWLTTPGPTPEWAYRSDPLDSISFLGQIANYQEYKR